MKELTNEELEYFNNQLAKRFMTDIEGGYISAPFMDIPIGVRLIPLPSAEDVNNVNESEIKDNEIYFYTTSLKQAVYHLLRHLRNCAAHKGRIKRDERQGRQFYYFEDIYSSCLSMRGNVAVDKWNGFIEELYKVALENKIEKKSNSKNK